MNTSVICETEWAKEVRVFRLQRVEDKAVSADLHGLITSLSPLKKSLVAGNQYYDSEVCDGTQTLRFVGFHQYRKSSYMILLQC